MTRTNCEPVSHAPPVNNFKKMQRQQRERTTGPLELSFPTSYRYSDKRVDAYCTTIRYSMLTLRTLCADNVCYNRELLCLCPWSLLQEILGRLNAASTTFALLLALPSICRRCTFGQSASRIGLPIERLGPVWANMLLAVPAGLSEAPSWPQAPSSPPFCAVQPQR